MKAVYSVFVFSLPVCCKKRQRELHACLFVSDCVCVCECVEYTRERAPQSLTNG